MNIGYKYIIGAVLVVLTACNEKLPMPPVGEADGAIVLRAGISEGGSGVQTKAADGGHAGTLNGGAHKAFSENTKLTLRVDGIWLGKADGSLPHGRVSSTRATQTTTATIGAETAPDSKHNSVDFEPSEKLYWDDYGSAAPANIDDPKGTAPVGTGGRGIGLTIYGAAVDNVSPAIVINETTGKQWTALAWTLDSDQSSGWYTKDLLTSNNVRSAGDGTYKFDDYLHDLTESTKQSSNLLEFTHAMTKVTVNLTAGEGFVDGKFVEEPKVTLLGFNYTGTYNVETKTPAATAATNIKAHLAKVKATSETPEWSDAPATWATSHQTQFDALVFPGNQFPDATEILRIEADGNVYYINATAINTANLETNNTFEQAKNYIFKIIVNKTAINVTATITNWVDVESAEVSPEINVNADWGTPHSAVGSGFASFSFYRSSDAHTAETINTGYSAGIELINGFTPAAAVATKPASPADPANTQWPFQTIGASPVATKLFWPTHDTHYQFRGVWPLTSTDVIPVGTKPTAPHVQTVDSKQVINLYNTAYDVGSYPSDLFIGRPEFEHPESETCHNSDHTAQNLYTYGICATKGLVNLNFRYMMSQVEVVLSTTDPGDVDHVNLGANTVVEIVNGYTDGYVGLGDREVFKYGDKGSYTLDNVAGGGNELKRHSAIVPQDLTYTDPGASTNLRFKITVINAPAVLYANAAEYNAAHDTSLDDDEFAALSDKVKIKTPADTDIYYADVNPIKKSGSSELIAPNHKWESGVHYKYNLKIKKTEINVTASITDWVTVEGNEDVWF